jgi:hypothetical protein
MVVFGPNQIWSRFGFDLNFKFNRAHSSASSLLCLTHCSALLPSLPLLLHTAATYHRAACPLHSSTQAAIVMMM